MHVLTRSLTSLLDYAMHNPHQQSHLHACSLSKHLLLLLLLLYCLHAALRLQARALQSTLEAQKEGLRQAQARERSAAQEARTLAERYKALQTQVQEEHPLQSGDEQRMAQLPDDRHAHCCALPHCTAVRPVLP